MSAPKFFTITTLHNQSTFKHRALFEEPVNNRNYLATTLIHTVENEEAKPILFLGYADNNELIIKRVRRANNPHHPKLQELPFDLPVTADFPTPEFLNDTPDEQTINLDRPEKIDLNYLHQVKKELREWGESKKDVERPAETKDIDVFVKLRKGDEQEQQPQP